jgi:hypothetical protein
VEDVHRFMSLLCCQTPHLTGKSAGCPAFLPVGGGGEGGNGLPQWSQSRPCNHVYISRKPRPVGGQLHLNKISQNMFLPRGLKSCKKPVRSNLPDSTFSPMHSGLIRLFDSKYDSSCFQKNSKIKTYRIILDPLKIQIEDIPD